MLFYFNLKPIAILNFQYRLHPNEASDIALKQKTRNAKIQPIPLVKKIPKEICSICSKLVHRDKMKHHMSYHEEPKLECTKCDRKFYNTSSRKAHFNSAHTNTYLYSCEFCNKQFKDRTNLKNHRYSHTGGGNHTCANCNTNFIRRDQYNSHITKCMR